MEAEGHVPLKSGSNIFKARRHNTIHKRAPTGCEIVFILILFLDLNLVITEKTIHEIKYFVAITRINDLVNEWSGEVVFGTCQVQVMEVSTNANGTLFFDGNKIRNPSGIHDGVYETCFTQFLDLILYNESLCGVNGSLFLTYGNIISQVSI